MVGLLTHAADRHAELRMTSAPAKRSVRGRGRSTQRRYHFCRSLVLFADSGALAASGVVNVQEPVPSARLATGAARAGARLRAGLLDHHQRRGIQPWRGWWYPYMP